MNELEKNKYKEYRKAVFSLITDIEKEVWKEILKTSIEYYEHWDHALALDDILSNLNIERINISNEIIHHIQKISSKFQPDGIYFREETLELFNEIYVVKN